MRAEVLLKNYSLFDRCVVLDLDFSDWFLDKKKLFVLLSRFDGTRVEIFSRAGNGCLLYLGVKDGVKFLPYQWCHVCEQYEPYCNLRPSSTPLFEDDFGLRLLFGDDFVCACDVVVQDKAFLHLTNPFVCMAWHSVKMCQYDCDCCQCEFCISSLCPIHHPGAVNVQNLWQRCVRLRTQGIEFGQGIGDFQATSPYVFLDSLPTTPCPIDDQYIDQICGLVYNPIVRTSFTVVPGTIGNLFLQCVLTSKYRVTTYRGVTILLAQHYETQEFHALVLGYTDFPLVLYQEGLKVNNMLMMPRDDVASFFREIRARFGTPDIIDRRYSTLNVVYQSIVDTPTLIRLHCAPALDWIPPDWNVFGIGAKTALERCFRCKTTYFGKCPGCSARLHITPTMAFKMREDKRAAENLAEEVRAVNPALLPRLSWKKQKIKDISQDFEIVFNKPEKGKLRFPGKVISLRSEVPSTVLANIEREEPEKPRKNGVILAPVRGEPMLKKQVTAVPNKRKAYQPRKSNVKEKLDPVLEPVPEELILSELFGDCFEPARLEAQGLMPSRMQETVMETASNINALAQDLRAVVNRFTPAQLTQYVTNVFQHLNIPQLTTRALGLIVHTTRHNVEWNSLLFFFIDLAFDLSDAISVCANQNAEQEAMKACLTSNISDVEKVKKMKKMLHIQGINSIFDTLIGVMSGLSNKTLKYLSSFNTLVTAWRNGSKLTRSLLGLLPKCIQEMFGLVTDNVLLTDPDYQEFVERFTIFDKAFTADPKNIRAHSREVLLKTLVQAIEFRQRATICVASGAVGIFLRCAISRLETMLSVRDDDYQLSFKRYNPFAILLHGAPRTGKSQVAKKIARHIEEWAKDESLMNDPVFSHMARPGVYAYQSQLAYMDGYQQQGVVVVDELGAQADGSDLLPFYSLVSSNTYVCPMASLENPIVGKKGTTFTSHTVIACSNSSSFSHLANTYFNPEAIDGRFIFKVEVIPTGPQMPDFSHLRFRVSIHGISLADTFTLAELLYIIKMQPKYGFMKFFETQRHIDTGLMKIGPVDISRMTVQGTGDAVLAVLTYMANFLALGYGINLAVRTSGLAQFTGIFTAIVSGLSILSILVSASALEQQVEKTELLVEANENLKERNQRLLAFLGSYRPQSSVTRAIVDDVRYEVQSRSPKNMGPRRRHRKLPVVQGTPDDYVAGVDLVAILTNIQEDPDMLERLRDWSDMLNVLLKRRTVDVRPSVLDPNAEDLKYQLECQGLEDTIATGIENKCAHALCAITITRNSLLVQSMNAVPLGHVYVLTPVHLFETAEGDDDVEIHWMGANLKHSAKLSTLPRHQIDQDAVVVGFPMLPFRFPSLSRNFISEKELDFIVPGPVSLVTRNRTTTHVTIYSSNGELIEEGEQYDGPTRVYTITRGFHYEINSACGDCGGPLIIHNNNIRGKITGIHVAGLRGIAYGISTLVTREMIEKVIDIIEYEHIMPTRCVTMGAISCVGLHKPPMFQPVKSAFYRTHLSCFTPEKFPVELRPTKTRDPVLNAMMKNARRINATQFDEDKLNECVDYLSKFFPENRNRQIYSFDEALKQQGALGGLNLKTSPGYPYVLNSKKSDYIIKDEFGEYHVVDEKIRLDVEKLAQESETIPPNIVWVSCGKDECLKPGKDPRVFEIAPMSYTILGRQYFGAFIDWIHSNPLLMFSAVGINPESHLWDKLYQRLLKVSNCCLDVDWKLYDSTLPPGIMRAVYRLINLWYEDAFGMLRLNICEASLSRLTIFREFVLLILGGNPSGHFLTTIVNTLGHVLLYLYFWVMKAPLEMCDLYFFRQLISLVVYGDDGIMTIAPSIQEWFNFAALRDFFAAYGMRLTSSVKDGTDAYFKPVHECTFLKRGFRRDRGLWIPLLSKTSLTTMVLFNRKSKFATEDETFRVNARIFAQFMYFYGREEFLKLVPLLGVVVPTYDYFDRVFRGIGEFPLTL